MTDKYLIDNLKQLKEISPDKKWQKEAKSIFMSQINNSGAKSLSYTDTVNVFFKSLFTLSLKPVVMTIGFFFLLVTTSVFAHQVFENSKPDDSLYIARIISERAKLSTVLDSKSRERLATKFAASHAEEISLMLADPNFDLEANEERVARLSNNFNREIDTVRTRVMNWASTSTEEIVPTNTSAEIIDSVDDDDILIAIADNDKDDSGISIAINDDEEEDDEDEYELILEELKEIKDPSLVDLVNEAQDLYLQGLNESNKEKLSEAGSKLQQVKEIINNK